MPMLENGVFVYGKFPKIIKIARTQCISLIRIANIWKETMKWKNKDELEGVGNYLTSFMEWM